jgi:hypothetical protein
LGRPRKLVFIITKEQIMNRKEFLKDTLKGIVAGLVIPYFSTLIRADERKNRMQRSVARN